VDDTTKLIEFIRANIAADKRIARAVPVAKGCVPPAHWDDSREDGWVTGTFEDINAHTAQGARHLTRHDPARVLREVEAKTKTLVRCQEEMLSGIPRLVHFAEQTLREMAAAYGYQPSSTVGAITGSPKEA
jgi:hypothetical protein